MQYLGYCKLNNINIEFDYVNIFTDSKVVCDLLDIKGYPKYNYYYQIIERILKLCLFRKRSDFCKYTQNQ